MRNFLVLQTFDRMSRVHRRNEPNVLFEMNGNSQESFVSNFVVEMYCRKLITWNDQIRITQQMRDVRFISRRNYVFLQMLKGVRGNTHLIAQGCQNGVQNLIHLTFMINERFSGSRKISGRQRLLAIERLPWHCSWLVD